MMLLLCLPHSWGDEMVFLGEDAISASDILGIECQSYRIARGKSVPYLGIPMGEANKAFVTLFEQGATVAVAMAQADAAPAEPDIKVVMPTLEEPEPFKQEPVQRKRFQSQSLQLQLRISLCRVAVLSDPDSVAAGMGEVCRGHAGLFSGNNLREHYASVSIEELPDDMIPISQLIKAAKAIGISKHRMVEVLGGDRALRKPLLPIFQVHYYKHYRYVKKEALEHLEEARLK